MHRLRSQQMRERMGQSTIHNFGTTFEGCISNQAWWTGTTNNAGSDGRALTSSPKRLRIFNRAVLRGPVLSFRNLVSPWHMGSV